jgi:hypothetical protein
MDVKTLLILVLVTAACFLIVWALALIKENKRLLQSLKHQTGVWWTAMAEDLKTHNEKDRQEILNILVSKMQWKDRRYLYRLLINHADAPTKIKGNAASTQSQKRDSGSSSGFANYKRSGTGTNDHR